VCGDCEYEIIDGGDAACANATGNLEPPPSKQGCCYYCTLRRDSWFSRSKCTSAPRRTLFNTSLLAHRLPPGAPPGATYVCPAEGCTHVISGESEKLLVEQRARLNDKQLSRRDLKHRNAHTGVWEGRLKLQWQDNVKRAPSLLHFVLNSSSSTIVIILKRGGDRSPAPCVERSLRKAQLRIPFQAWQEGT
jgi:hypothetical protein